MYRPKKDINRPVERPGARYGLDRALRKLQDNMLTLSSLVARTILESLEILAARKPQAAIALIQSDKEINKRRYGIESDCLSIIARQSPIATDLRIITAVMEIATELERISDYAKGIAKVSLVIPPEQELFTYNELMRMGVKVQGMLRRTMLAFIERDVTLAYQLAAQDSQVDAIYRAIHEQLMEIGRKEPEQVVNINYLLWVAHNLERTGDRVTNMCERIVFMVTGRFVELGEGGFPVELGDSS
jgi:phosphate transport system protein